MTFADSGTLKEKDYTFFWQGKRSNEPRKHGVGFSVRNSLLRMVEPGRQWRLRAPPDTPPYLSHRPSHPNQRVCQTTVYHTRHKRHVLPEPCIHHQEYSQQGTSCCSGWLQCQSGCRSRLVALLPWSVWSGQNKWKRTVTTGAVHLPWPVHYKLLLPHQASTQGFVETPTLKAMASAGSNLGQACFYQECSPHTLLPQQGLWYRPLLGVL